MKKRGRKKYTYTAMRAVDACTISLKKREGE